MFEFKFCRICLDDNVRMHPILGSQVQDVYEKITNKKVQDGTVHLACYICHRQLQNCQEVLIKAHTSDELLKQFLSINSELDEYPVSFVTRMTYGLVHSLSASNIQSLQIPEHNKIIKTESHSESDNEEAMAEDGPHYEDTITKEEHELNEDHICNNDISESLENEQNKNISDLQSNTLSNENTSHQMLCDGTSNQLVNDIKMFICNDCGKTCDTKARLIKHISGHKPANMKPDAMFQEALAQEAEAKGTRPNKKLKLDKKHNCEQDKAKCIENGKNENISETERSVVPAKDKSAERVYHGKRELVLVNNNEGYFICNECGKTCYSKAFLIKHIFEHKPAITKQNTTCKTNESSLYYRISTKSDNACKSLFVCQICKYKFDSDRNLRKHMHKTHKCRYCGYTCEVKKCLKVHIKTHKGELKRYKCQYCSYTCARIGHFTRHNRKHTGDKPFKCQNCDSTCTTNSDLMRHVRTHTGEKPFKCQYCSYTGACKSSLTVHNRTHTGERPYKCQYCDCTFTNKSNLMRHTKTHTGEKPFKCQYCSYTCAESSALKNHTKTHTGEKPFKCQYCSYTCAVSGRLRRHTKTHTGEKPFKCQYCSYTCAESSSLKRHTRTHKRK